MLTAAATAFGGDLSAGAGAAAEAAVALLSLFYGSTGAGQGAKRMLTDESTRAAHDGGTCFWGNAAAVEEPNTPTARAASPAKRRCSWSKPQSRVDMQAAAIKKMLDSTNTNSATSASPQWISEGAIRGALGNTPDTSKGLRKLRSDGIIVRRGAGGRSDPFQYMLKRDYNQLYPDAQQQATKTARPRSSVTLPTSGSAAGPLLVIRQPASSSAIVSGAPANGAVMPSLWPFDAHSGVLLNAPQGPYNSDELQSWLPQYCGLVYVAPHGGSN